MARNRSDRLDVWPAFTDTMLAFILILVLMVSYQVARSTEFIDPDPGVIQRQQDQERVEKLIEAFKDQGYNIQVSTNGVIQNLRFGSDVTFRSGSAQLSEQGVNLLDNLAQEITGRGSGAQIRTLTETQVGGHTDNVPINNRRFDSNWELSTARATRVVESLIESGVDPTEITMSATGYGEYAPRATNGTATGRKKNRRIEMRLIYTNTLPKNQN